MQPEREAPGFLAVAGWEELQHYKTGKHAKGTPAWVKAYVSVLDDYELNSQAAATRHLYDRLTLLAARLDNRIPDDPAWIARCLWMDENDVRHGLLELLRIGRLVPHEDSPSNTGLAEV